MQKPTDIVSDVNRFVQSLCKLEVLCFHSSSVQVDPPPLYYGWTGSFVLA